MGLMEKTTHKTSRSHELAQVGLAARRAAVDVLEAVIDNGRSLDDVLDRDAGLSSLRALIAKDRALARAIVGTALRRRGQITDALDRLLDQPLPGRARRVTHILHVAAAQILFMDVPDHAAVSLGVTTTAGHIKTRSWKNLVNGVLRNLARRRAAILADQDAERLNTPDWLWRRWTESYGAETARAIAAMHLVEPALDLTVRADPKAWAERLGADLLPGGSLRLVAPGAVEHIDGFSEGAWWVQDLAASIPARLFGDVAGKRVADLCAAPGGKTVQLAAAGADVTAVDISSARLARLGENLGRLGLDAHRVTADLLDWAPKEPFDAVLLDAPCSSTGTIRRHPDILLTKRDTDIASLAERQEKLLRRAVEWVRPGGLLVYSTCSLEPEEGEAQIARLLAGDDRFERVAVAANEVWGLDEIVTSAGEIRSLPCHLRREDPRLSGLDGFFAARLRRRPSR